MQMLCQLFGLCKRLKILAKKQTEHYLSGSIRLICSKLYPISGMYFSGLSRLWYVGYDKASNILYA